MEEKYFEMLCCPACNSRVNVQVNQIICQKCGRIYPIIDSIPIMFVDKIAEKSQMLEFYNSDKYIDHVSMSAQKLKDDRKKLIHKWLKISEVENIVELGCSTGTLQDIHPNYIGLDISLKALKKVKNGICCDIEEIPLINNSVSSIVSFTTLEHVQNPEKVLDELDRILIKGGMIILADAWNVRTWTSSGITKLQWEHATLKEKFFKIIYSILGSIYLRAFYFVPRRFYWEIRSFLSPKLKTNLFYKKLNPNYEDFITSDSDAVSSIESHSVLMWFKSRGYELLNAGGILKRLFFRGYIVVKKRT